MSVYLEPAAPICAQPNCTKASTCYDDFYGELCDEHWEAKVKNATTNPWTGESR